MSTTNNKAQNDMLVALHTAIVDDPFLQSESISHHEVVEIMAAVLNAQPDRIRNDVGKQHTDKRR